jgi:hypothetical protein
MSNLVLEKQRRKADTRRRLSLEIRAEWTQVKVA